jgi:hypothetical protein
MLATVSRAPLLIGLVAVDPIIPANRIVTAIDNAPRNANGRSRFRAREYRAWWMA